MSLACYTGFSSALKNKSDAWQIKDFILILGIELEFYSSLSIAELENQIAHDKLDLLSAIKKEEGFLQYEVVTKPTHKIGKLIEQVCLFKEMTKGFCDFSAKPFLDAPGNAMHVNISAHDPSSMQNVLGPETQTKMFMVGGLCQFIKRSMRYFAPTISSYKRFQYCDKFTPKFAIWGFEDNKSNAIRVTKDIIEHRVPCADSKPDLVIYEILKAIEYGVAKKIIPASPNFGEPSYLKDFESRFPLSYKESCVVC